MKKLIKSAVIAWAVPKAIQLVQRKMSGGGTSSRRVTRRPVRARR